MGSLSLSLKTTLDHFFSFQLKGYVKHTDDYSKQFKNQPDLLELIFCHRCLKSVHLSLLWNKMWQKQLILSCSPSLSPSHSCPVLNSTAFGRTLLYPYTQGWVLQPMPLSLCFGRIDMNSFLLHVLILGSLLNDTPGYFGFSECLTFLIVHGHLRRI